MSLLVSILTHPFVEGAVRIAGLSFLAGVATAIAAFIFRVRVHGALPEGPTVILGLGTVAVYLNTRLVFVQFLGDGEGVLTTSEALLNVGVFVAAGIASYGGRYAGDKAGQMERFKLKRLQPDFSPIVRAAGRFITVTLPDEIADIEGYDPVEEKTKDALAGQTFDFPRGLTVTELQTQLAARLKEENDIGYVDVDLTEDGAVEYLAVGQRVAGIGPTLPPKSAAVAVRADPPFSATPGDTIQLWRTDTDGAEHRVGTGELRASVGSFATVVTDESIARTIDPMADYRLMTLSANSHPDKEFATMLRRGAETMSIVEIAAGSPLVDTTVGSLDVTIVAVRTPGGEIETIPKRNRPIQAGDNLFAIGRPDALRKLESIKGAQVQSEETELFSDAVDLGDATNGEAPAERLRTKDGAVGADYEE